MRTDRAQAFLKGFQATVEEQRSAITGVVQDTAGTVLPGVNVQIAGNALAERVRSAVTDGDGRYTISGLPHGVYVVTFSLQGFAAQSRAGVQLAERFTATVNARMKIVGARGSSDDEQAAQPQRTPDEPPRFQLGAGVLGAGAVGDFGTGVDGAWGALVHMDVGLGKSPFSVGGEFGGMGYGAERRSVYIGDVVPDIPNLSLKVNTDNEMWLGHVRVRAQRRVGRWRPYADALLGFAELATRTSINGALSCSSIPQTGVTCSSETAAEATNAKDYVRSYGAAAGVMIGFTSSPQSPRLDLSVRYHRGGVAEYLTEGAIVREGGRATLNLSRSRTDMVMVYCGLAIGR